MLDDYEATQREKYADLNAQELRTKFSVNKTQEEILDTLVDDYKKGKLSSTALSTHIYVWIGC